MNGSDSTTCRLLNCSFVSSHAQSAMHVVRESMLGVPTPDLLSVTRSLQISRLLASLAIDTFSVLPRVGFRVVPLAWICPCDPFLAVACRFIAGLALSSSETVAPSQLTRSKRRPHFALQERRQALYST
jgi:hypothetical protein